MQACSTLAMSHPFPQQLLDVADSVDLKFVV
jgi:hypothetical protein